MKDGNEDNIYISIYISKIIIFFFSFFSVAYNKQGGGFHSGFNNKIIFRF